MTYDDGFRDSPAFRDSVAYRETMSHARNMTGLRDGNDEETTSRSRMYMAGSHPVGDSGYGPDDASQQYEQPYEQPYEQQYEPRYQQPRAPQVPRDRVAVHFGWEFLLLAGAAAVAVLLYRTEPSALRGESLKDLYIQATLVGLVAVGMGLSLRAAVPNLALGPMVFASAMFFAENSDRGLLVTAGVTALLAAAAGIAIAIVVTAFHVPAWAASIAAGCGLIVWIQGHKAPVEIVGGAYKPVDNVVIIFAVFVVLSVLGGIFGLMPGLRRGIGRYRPAGDPAARGRGAVSAALALIGSSLFAAAAGVLLAFNNREIAPTENGIGLTALALGAVLLGGTSIYGRHGGLFGTALAVVGLILLTNYAAAENRSVSVFALAGAAIAVGLLVSRLIELLGRPKMVPEVAAPVEVAYEPEPEPAGDPTWQEQGYRPKQEDRWDERWAGH